MFIWDWFTGVLGYLGKYKLQKKKKKRREKEEKISEKIHFEIFNVICSRCASATTAATVYKNDAKANTKI